MIWALLALLGVPIWLVVGALAATLWNRRRFRSQPGVFPIALRPTGRESWPRTVSYGRLVHDVLVVNRGLALVRTELYPIVDVRPLDGVLPGRKIVAATGRLLGVDGHDDIEVAVPERVRRELDALAGTAISK